MASPTLLRRGARAKPRPVLGIRELSKDDLLTLEVKRDTPVVQRFRDSHHMVARLSALGLRADTVAERCGFSRSRVLTLWADPAFKELIAHYRKLVTEDYKEAVEDFISLATINMMKAERMLADKLDEADSLGETLSTRELVTIVSDRADRVGFGKKQTNINVNVDFAAKLTKAIERASKARTLDLKPVDAGAATPSSLPSLATATSLPASAPAVEKTSLGPQVQPFIRRA